MKFDITDKTDYEVFNVYVNSKDEEEKRSIEHQMYERYKYLVFNMKADLNKRVKKCNYVSYELKECVYNYENDVYYRFIMAMESVRLDKIKPTWKFWFPFWGYLNTYNRDTMHNYISSRNEVSLDYIKDSDDAAYKRSLANAEADSSVNIEDQVIDKINSEVINKAIKSCLSEKFSPVQVKIWNYKANNDKCKISEICKACDVSPKVYKSELQQMKGILNVEYKKLSREDLF